MTGSMLVRAGAGWEQLAPQTTLPDGGITDVFGDDISAVLGTPNPMTVVAASPTLATGKPDAIVVDIAGNISIVTMQLGARSDQALANLLSFAGAMHSMSYDDFGALCNRVTGNGGLAGHIKAANAHAQFHKGTFEVTVADALAQGRFGLIAIVSSAPAALVQSLKYLNASGAAASCYEASLFSSESVMAVNVQPVDVGQPQAAARSSETRVSAAGLLALTEQTVDANTAQLMAAFQKACGGVFDTISYDGDAKRAEMHAACTVSGTSLEMVCAASDGSVIISFENLAPADADWSVRAELAQGMSRLLGADLGDVKKISQLNLDIREHLMDVTLIEALAEILGDTASALRAEGEGAAAADGAVAAAA